MEDAAIQQGFENLRDGAAYDNLFAASECRAKADWLIGMNGTRAFTKKYGRKQTIGRVQTPTLAMLAERQAKIQNFVKEEQIEQSKAEESTKSVVPGTVRAAAEQAENFLNGTRLTASMVSAFIENVFVYDGGRIVVRFKYEQSIQNAVKALHTD